MQVGKKGTGQDSHSKLCVIRHGGGTRRSCNSVEKAIESGVRQAGKKVCRGKWKSEY